MSRYSAFALLRQAAGARQLGVGDLIAPGPQVAGHLDADQEVGVTAPATVEERSLIDDVGTVAHGRLGLGLGRQQLGGCAQLRSSDLPDRPPRALELIEIGPLMRLAMLLHELERRVVGSLWRPLPASLDSPELECA